MSKEKALGSIPTFESVERATADLDLFNNEPKEESTKEKLKKDILKDILKEKEDFKKTEKEATIEEMQEDIEEHSKHIEKMQEEALKKETKAGTTKEVASTQRAVRKGYIRQTFVISEENLELIRALTSFLNTKQVDLLEALINKGLEVFSEEDKEEALRQYRNNPKEEKESILNKYFN